MKTDIHAVVGRQIPPEPWTEGEKIPWNDPAFSERMLAEHLSQAHDAASRRDSTIEAQVDWIHTTLLGGRPARVLDLGCGPGLYAHRLRQLGHGVHGIDFSPASIRYARSLSEAKDTGPTFDLADIRSADYGDDYDLVMLLYGELNVFTRADALAILSKARRALGSHGRLFVEAHTYGAIRAEGNSPPRWRSLARGLFADDAHLLLEESFWDQERAASTHRWFVIHVGGEVERHADSMQAYTSAGYEELFADSGFVRADVSSNWPTAPDQEALFVALTAHVPDGKLARRRARASD